MRARLLLVALVALSSGATSFADDSKVAKEIAKIALTLDDWLARANGSKPLSVPRETWLRARIDELEDYLAADPAQLHRVATEFLDLAAFDLTHAAGSGTFSGGNEAARIRAHGLDALERLLETDREDELVDWIARGVLAEAHLNPPERRWIALHLLRDKHSEAIDQTLLCVARDTDDPLRPDALSEVPGCSSATADLFLVQLLDAPRDPLRDPHPFDLLRKRLERGPLARDAEAELRRRTKSMILSEDWREASRGLALASGLDPMRSAPMLIEALHTWKIREGRLGGARRLIHEIVEELQGFSGRSIGASPRNWTTWWQAVSKGTIPFCVAEQREGETRTVATFFGLEPASDRVTFVIDHSGSMVEPWGSTGHSRYVEAIEQLSSYLQSSGENTLFDVVLFDTTPRASTPQSVRATPDMIERARSALVRRQPDGSTNLKLAIEHALRVDAEGRVDPARVACDTIVVLCDGATTEGPGWVEPFLERVGADLRVVFHCVLLGPNDDGTLAALARCTGGEFVRIDG